MWAIDARRVREEGRLHRHNFRVATDAPASPRPLPTLRGDLVIGYDVMRRIYAVSLIRSQLARDVQSFFRHVRGRGSSRDLSRRPDMSVVRWTLRQFRVWIICQFVQLSFNHEVSVAVIIFY